MASFMTESRFDVACAAKSAAPALASFSFFFFFLCFTEQGFWFEMIENVETTSY
uniref:Uncharacterized protein n=1 Tax=Heterorhabditis bacteriophora TaxID=37862 RepID=A0A1I7WJX7_HETBA